MHPADVAAIAATLDQTLLKPDVGPAGYREFIARSRDAGFASLCVPPAAVPLAVDGLGDSPTVVCTVIGFPLGYSTTLTKADEAARMVALGAVEVDMVIAIGPLLEGADEIVSRDIAAVVDAASKESDGTAITKVILETAYLDEAQIAHACGLAVGAGAHFVKTSTGFGPRGATVRDIEIMRAAVGPEIGVKASGGIRDLAAAVAMLDAGASRIGTSAGLDIVAAAAAQE